MIISVSRSTLSLLRHDGVRTLTRSLSSTLYRGRPVTFSSGTTAPVSSPVLRLGQPHQQIGQLRSNQIRKFSSSHAYSPEDDSLIQLIKNRVYVFRQGRQISRTSKRLFNSCEEQTYSKAWYNHGKLANVFRDKHLLLVIHVWMCHRRLVSAYASGEDVRAERLQECFFDCLWDDSTTRLAEADISSLFINKYLKQVQTLSFHICHELDNALALPFVEIGPVPEGEEPTYLTEEQMHDAAIGKIGEVVWNHFFDSNPDMEESHILEFARYILVEQHRIHTIPYEQFLKGDLEWSPVPKFPEPDKPGIKAGKGPGRKWKPLPTSD